MFAFIGTFIFMGTYAYEAAQQADEDRDGYDNFIACIVQAWWESGVNVVNSSAPIRVCINDKTPDLVMMDVQACCFASLGSLSFLVFGLGNLIKFVKKKLKESELSKTLQNKFKSDLKSRGDFAEGLISSPGLPHHRSPVLCGRKSLYDSGPVLTPKLNSPMDAESGASYQPLN